ncbi:MAG TPA: TIGR01777 family oxidoreductase [Gemmatimonadales bacterium]
MDSPPTGALTTPRTIAISGASGLVGTAVAKALAARGDRVLRLVRKPPGQDEMRWDPAGGAIDAPRLEGVDGVVHLAGESIAAGRWTAERKRRIRDSRVAGTRLLAGALSRLARKPAVLVSASAVGIYGDRGDEPLDESSATGQGFLAEVGREWEAAIEPAAGAGIRVVLPRLGIVLASHGGALAKMLPPFRLGLGGPLGRGTQWMSWITLDDAVGVVLAALDRPDLAGPVNAVAPGPVTNAEFTRLLAAAVHRPAIFPVPAVALELLFGEMAREALLASQRVLPRKLTAAGFAFGDPVLGPALRRVVSRES